MKTKCASVLSLSFSLLICIVAKGQMMPVGIFRNISGDTIRQFVFRGNDSIATYYVSSTYGAARMENGTYSLKGNRLVLNAIRPICEVGEEQYSDLVTGLYKKDSSLLEIFWGLEGVSLAGKGSKSGKFYGATSHNGYLNLAIANVDIPIKLTTGYAGYKNVEITIDSIGIHLIKCPLVASNIEGSENSHKPVFIIKKHSQQQIVAREINEKKFRVYRFTTKQLPPKVRVD